MEDTLRTCIRDRNDGTLTVYMPLPHYQRMKRLEERCNALYKEDHKSGIGAFASSRWR